MEDVLVTMADHRNAGHCGAGVREFYKTHNLDLRRMVLEGIPVSELIHIEDANMQRVIEVARQRAVE